MKHIFGSLAFLLITFLVSEFIFNPTNLYYELPWLDIPVHIIGGFGVASLVVSVMSYKDKHTSLGIILCGYIVVALGWELYEYIKDIMHNSAWNGWHDTLGDVINGGVGAFVAYLFFKK